MADNVEITAGSGTPVATDDVSGVHYQRVKLVDGTLNSTAAIPGDASNGLDVDVTRVQGTVTVGDGGSTLSVDDGGGSLTVDVSGTVPVSAASLPLPSGAATAAKQPALGTAGTPSTDVLTVQGHASGTALKTDGSGVTQPVSAASLPLPSGASTAAKQPALGTAGTASADVLTVQGIASMTALKTDGSAVTQPVSGTVTAHAGTGPWPVTDNGGSLTVDGTVAATQSGTWNVGTLTSVTNVVHVDDNSGTLSVDDGAGSITVDNAGTFAVQATVAAGATNIAKAEDVASADADVGVPAMAVRKATPANTSGTDGDYEFLQMSAGRLWASATIDAALPAGTNAIGKLAANSGVDIGDVDVTSVSGTVTVGGTAATDAAVSGNPVLVGGRASTTKPSAVSADGDAVPLWLTLSGAMVTSSLIGLTSTLSNVAASASSTSLLSSNTARRSVTIVNDSASICRVKEGTTASATSFTWLLQPYDTLNLDGQHSGAIDAIWDTATGSARITERA